MASKLYILFLFLRLSFPGRPRCCKTGFQFSVRDCLFLFSPNFGSMVFWCFSLKGWLIRVPDFGMLWVLTFIALGLQSHQQCSSVPFPSEVVYTLRAKMAVNSLPGSIHPWDLGFWQFPNIWLALWCFYKMFLIF